MTNGDQTTAYALSDDDLYADRHISTEKMSKNKLHCQLSKGDVGVSACQRQTFVERNIQKIIAATFCHTKKKYTRVQRYRMRTNIHTDTTTTQTQAV